jgi:hypothetical protein
MDSFLQKLCDLPLTTESEHPFCGSATCALTLSVSEI